MGNSFREVLSGQEKNYMMPFFWQHGESEEVLREYMGAIADANISAVCVESRPHPDFCGDRWWRDMDIILDEARNRGMKVWILDDSHFPTGYANGAVENAPKELCHQYLDYRKLQMHGPVVQCEINVEEYAHPEKVPPFLPQPPAPKRVFDDDQLYGVVAYQVAEKGGLVNPVDLTAFVKDGKLVWDMPKGYWEIYILYLTRDAKGRNDYINLLDKDSCRLLLDAVYEPHFEHYKNDFGKTIAGFFSDETPVGNTDGYTVLNLIGKKDMALPWARELPRQMKKFWPETKDWKCYLPLLWQESADTTLHAKFRVAFMDAVTTLIQKNFSEQIGQWCEAHGVEYIGHVMEHCDVDTDLGPCVGHFYRGISGQHMAGIDNIGGQVLPGGKSFLRSAGTNGMDDSAALHYTLGKLGASAAAIDPKKRGRCMCENLGAYGWQCGMSVYKYLMDHFMVRGVNYFVPHAFSPAPFPDPDCPPHFYAHGKNPQYRAFGKLMQYSNRICHLIQGGVAKPDVAVLYHGENAWTGDYRSNLHIAEELTQNQIDFHIIPADVFDHRDYYQVKLDKDKLTINGNEYRLLIVSGNNSLYGPAAVFMKEALEIGFPIFFENQRPVYLTGNLYGYDENSLLHFIAQISVYETRETAEAIRTQFSVDFKIKPSFSDLSVYHYTQNQDIFLILNESISKAFSGEITLSAGQEVVQYDAWSNECIHVEQHHKEGEVTVCLELEPMEMVILVCTEDICKKTRRKPDASWKKQFLDGFYVSQTLAENYPDFGSETYLKKPGNMACQYPDFSGYYRYRKMIEADKGRSAVLELQDVYDAVEVFLNGISIGTKVQAPYLFDLTDHIKDGENELVIETATTLEREVHALGGDVSCMNLPAPMMPTGIAGDIILYTTK